MVQGKSSCLPAYFLMKNILNHETKEKNIKFDVIDCCAAPGNKTIQLSEYIESFGKVFAFEKNKKRFDILVERINYYGIKNVECFNQDFLKTDPNDEQFKNVKYILLDPSCSGSGMLNNLFFEKNQNILEKYQKKLKTNNNKQMLYKKFIEEISLNSDENRLQNLQNFQIKILNHCLQFSIIKLVYSTCSCYLQENEKVIEEVLSVNNNFKLINLHKNGLNFTKGFSQDKEIKKCLRTNILDGNLDGFFVAVFIKK